MDIKQTIDAENMPLKIFFFFVKAKEFRVYLRS